MCFNLITARFEPIPSNGVTEPRQAPKTKVGILVSSPTSWIPLGSTEPVSTKIPFTFQTCSDNKRHFLRPTMEKGYYRLLIRLDTLRYEGGHWSFLFFKIAVDLSAMIGVAGVNN